MSILTHHRTLKISIVFVCLTALVGLSMKGRLTHEPFDSDKWKNWVETEETWSLRWDMMNDLRQGNELIGKSKPEILELLGEPNHETNSNYSYGLGYSKHGINTGVLRIEFDQQNKVISYDVYES
jgi:hypothetical protein